jgi:hypothetical protein
MRNITDRKCPTPTRGLALGRGHDVPVIRVAERFV